MERALSVKAGCAELLSAYIDVEPVGFNRGCFTVNIRYFYRITAHACVGAARPVEVCGLAVFEKRVVLYGGESGAKVFHTGDNDIQASGGCRENGMPEAVVESVDPVVLGIRLVDSCECRCCECGLSDIPVGVSNSFDEDLVWSGENRRLYVTLGQFSIVRLERDTHLLIPAYDYCLPEKECTCGGCDCREDPCESFRKVQFPVEEFFPSDQSCSCGRDNDYRDYGCRDNGCRDNGCRENGSRENSCRENGGKKN